MLRFGWAAVAFSMPTFAAPTNASAICAFEHCPIVTTTLGRVEGITSRNINWFRGMPFAAPPTGSNRFRPPQPAQPWTGVRRALSTANQCPQLGVLGNEDCLYLHVAAPSHCTPDAPCPVMFWIYGGGFLLGDDDEYGFYDPRELARVHDVVVVATNYRLGALGFLSVGALQRESGGTVGNWAMLDQRAALRWASDNLAAFGGDPSQVTIFGQSAGGMSVCWHLAAPGSRGLFAHAIMQSGNCGGPWAFAPLDDSLGHGERVAAEAGCNSTELKTDAEMLECIRALPPHAMDTPTSVTGSKEWYSATLAAFRNIGSPGLPAVSSTGNAQPNAPRQPHSPPLSPIITFTPTVDGVELPARPLELLESGRGNPVPTIVGNTHDEGTLFASWANEIVPGISFPLQPGELHTMISAIFGAGWGNATSASGARVADAVVAQYPASDYPPGALNEWWRASAVVRDYIFACPSRRLARALDRRSVPVYRYHFAPDFCTQPSLEDAGWIDFQLLHCYHTSDLYYVWGHPWPKLGPARTFGPRMAGVTKVIQRYWSAFAHTADPNKPATTAANATTAAPWPRAHAPNSTVHKELTMRLAEDMRVEEDYRGAACDFLDRLCGQTGCY